MAERWLRTTARLIAGDLRFRRVVLPFLLHTFSPFTLLGERTLHFSITGTALRPLSLSLSLESLEKRYQVSFVWGRKGQAERMPLHGKRLDAVGSESSRHIVVTEAFWIEPIFQCGAPSTMTEHAAVPNAFK